MDTDRWLRIKALFNEALRKEPEERRAFLDEACGEDAALRKEVEDLLASHDLSEEYLELPTRSELFDEAPEEPMTSTRIGQYLLQRVISSGGMGTVYEALQEHPRRTVAVKVMKEGIASRSALNRFEYESQILARLTHPNIAHVIESGTHREEGADEAAGGRPYFVMEYVPDARSITDYAREKDLSLPERLKLFLQVCDAVHHGHQKGIIHRDLKPSNILVNPEGQVKVIDFGVARATDLDVKVTTALTDVGQLIGTVQYMSPEQCRADPGALDVRSDVYALGVVLYELLCEELPYDVKKAAVFEATRVICEGEPKRPSTTRRGLRGDVETIVLKALEKRRQRRYQTVGDFEADIERYLRGEVILARPAGPATRTLKLIKRNPVVSAALGMLLITLVGFSLYVLIWFYPRILAATDKAENQRLAALKAKAASEEDAANTRTINTFLEEMLSLANPIQAGREVKVSEMLDRAARRIDEEYPDRPGIEASLRKTIAFTYHGLGRYEDAETQMRKAAGIYAKLNGEEHLETLKTRVSLGAMVMEQGRLSEAESIVRNALKGLLCTSGGEKQETFRAQRILAEVLLKLNELPEAESQCRQALEGQVDALGEENGETLKTMSVLAGVLMQQGQYPGSERIFRKIIKARQSVPDDEHPNIFAHMNNLALVLEKQGKFSEAELIHREAYEISGKVLGKEHPLTLTFLFNRALVIKRLGELSEAESIMRDLAETRSRILGEDHPDTLSTLGCLAILLQRRGAHGEAEPILERVIEAQRRTLGEEHPKTLTTETALAITYMGQNKFSEAETLFREVLEVRRRVQGSDHPETLKAVHNLAVFLEKRSRYSEAESLIREAVEMRRRVLGEEHPDTLKSLYSLGHVLLWRNELAEAEQVYHTCLKAQRRILGNEHPDTLITMGSLAYIYQNQGKYAEAEQIKREVFEIHRRVLGEEHSDTLHSKIKLSNSLVDLDRFSEAESLLVEAFETCRRVLGDKHKITLEAMGNLGLCLVAQKRLSEAESILRRSVEIARDNLPKDHSRTTWLHGIYGKCLREYKQYDKAEDYLKRAYEASLVTHGEEHPQTEWIVELIVGLYEAWGKPDEAAEWRAKQ